MGTVELGPIPEYRRTRGLVDYETDVPYRASTGGFDVVLIAPEAGDGHYAVGHVILN
jgi:hypothetical protein